MRVLMRRTFDLIRFMSELYSSTPLAASADQHPLRQDMAAIYEIIEGAEGGKMLTLECFSQFKKWLLKSPSKISKSGKSTASGDGEERAISDMNFRFVEALNTIEQHGLVRVTAGSTVSSVINCQMFNWMRDD
jgi:hypothetical protein